jgi:hypothetical protein
MQMMTVKDARHYRQTKKSEQTSGSRNASYALSSVAYSGLIHFFLRSQF